MSRPTFELAEPSDSLHNNFRLVCRCYSYSSLDREEPIDIRIGVDEGILIPGLDEGIRTMKLGGVRRLYIPGELAFPKVQ